MILWKFTFREMKSRPGRATLTLLSIVIGVAAVVAVTVGTATTDRACQEMYANIAGRTAMEIVAAGDSYFDQHVADEIAQTMGVKAVVPSVQGEGRVRFKGNKADMMVMGIDPSRDAEVRDYKLAEGEFFGDTKKREVLLEKSFAQGIGAAVGDEILLELRRVGARGSLKSCKVVGLLLPTGAAGFKQGAIVFLPLRAAQSLIAPGAGQVNLLSVVLADGADEQAVAEAVATRLPKGLTSRTPAERSQLSKETFEKVQKGLDFAYVAILALAFFTILNTFLMNVGERRRQLAVLRAIGTTRRQLIRMLLLEGLTMGIMGTVLGAAAGIGGACLLTQSMGKVYATPMPALQITPVPFITAGILGPLVSLFAMFVPAWIAGRVSPLEGMRFIASEGRKRIAPWYVLMAVSVFVVTGSIMAACIVGYLPLQIMTVAGVVFTAAFVLLVPVVLGLLSWLVGGLLYPLLRTEGRIAQRQILRRRVRTTLTIGILYIAVSTAISLGTNILDTVGDIHGWLDKTLKGDYFIRLTQQEVASGRAMKMPESVGDDLRAVEGIATVDAFRRVDGTVLSPKAKNGKQAVSVYARDYTEKGVLPLDLREGDPTRVREQLREGGVVLGDVLAHRLNAKVGDEITFETLEGPKQLRVAATATSYWNGGIVIYMEGQTARRLLNADGVDFFLINTLPEARAAVGAKLKTLCDEKSLMLQSFVDVRKRVDDLTKGLIASLWGLLVLGLVVGGFAIANTLTMNVLEQTRELALLRVVAMTRWQVRKTILAQALIIGMIGMGTGILGGMVGAYVVNLSTATLLGHAPEFALHASLLAVCFVIGLAVIVAAAWIPAERAARLNLLIALQYE
jgi:putative ABC transport system permease protein